MEYFCIFEYLPVRRGNRFVYLVSIARLYCQPSLLNSSPKRTSGANNRPNNPLPICGHFDEANNNSPLAGQQRTRTTYDHLRSCPIELTSCRDVAQPTISWPTPAVTDAPSQCRSSSRRRRSRRRLEMRLGSPVQALSKAESMISGTKSERR